MPNKKRCSNFRFEKGDSLSQVRLSVFPAPGGGGGGTLIFSCICRLGLFWGVQSFIFQYFGGGFRKLNIFGGIEDFVDIFGGHHKIGLYDAF